MGMVDVWPSRRGQALHAIVARNQEHRAHDIDENMDPPIEAGCCVTVTLVYCVADGAA